MLIKSQLRLAAWLPAALALLTSSEEEIDMVRTYDPGASSFMVKPVESEAFVQAVSQLGLYWMLLNKLLGDTT